MNHKERKKGRKVGKIETRNKGQKCKDTGGGKEVRVGMERHERRERETVNGKTETESQKASINNIYC
jgi:hypothetical protein